MKLKYNNRPILATVGEKEYLFRSQGEFKLARYFQILKDSGHIRDWEYEAHRFKMCGGLITWLIDFVVRNNDNSFEYYEFKGFVRPEDKRKLIAVHNDFPKAKITMVMADARGIKKLGKRASSCCYRVCTLPEITRGFF